MVVPAAVGPVDPAALRGAVRAARLPRGPLGFSTNGRQQQPSDADDTEPCKSPVTEKQPACFGVGRSHAGFRPQAGLPVTLWDRFQRPGDLDLPWPGIVPELGCGNSLEPDVPDPGLHHGPHDNEAFALPGQLTPPECPDLVHEAIRPPSRGWDGTHEPDSQPEDRRHDPD